MYDGRLPARRRRDQVAVGVVLVGRGHAVGRRAGVLVDVVRHIIRDDAVVGDGGPIAVGIVGVEDRVAGEEAEVNSPSAS